MSRRNYEEVDIRERRRGSEREIEFLRDDYGRTSAGPLVVRDDRSDSIRSKSRQPERLREQDVIERDEVIIARGPRERSREREYEREEIAYRARDVPIARAVMREEVVYRPREREPPAPPPPPPPPQIAREREEFVFRRQPPEASYEREQITIREREREREQEKERPRDRNYEKEEIIIRRDERERERERPRERDYQEEEVIFRREERPRDREKAREKIYEEELIIRRDERERAPPKGRDRSYDREEIIIRNNERDRDRQRRRASSYERQEISIRTEEKERFRARSRGEIREEDIIIRRDEREKPRARSRDRREEEEITIRRETRERDQPRERSRERSYRGNEEDILIRHEENGRRHKDEVIIRRKEPEPAPEPEPEYAPPPPPAPEPIRAPPILQEIITHHRHIDHGFERAPISAPPRPRSPSPKPRSPSPPPSFTEIDIRHRDSHNGRYHEDDIRIEHSRTRQRSLSPPVRHAYGSRDERDIAEEAEYYNKRVSERAYIGEGFRGATKDWAIVDVPPGTSRVEMEGVGGASQEITWQRYNGVRRSKFITDDERFDSDRERERMRGYKMKDEMQMKSYKSKESSRDIDTRDAGRRFVAEKEDPMWTEITKDLVIKEAIEEMGYDYEETEYFFYVMVYLRYEDVLNLVETTERIRRDRRARIREIEFERSVQPAYERRREPLALGWDEEKVYEREVIYEPAGSRRYR